MGVATERETWIGKAVPRIEDETLLRGEGRFMDDIDPVRNAQHAIRIQPPIVQRQTRERFRWNDHLPGRGERKAPNEHPASQLCICLLGAETILEMNMRR